MFSRIKEGSRAGKIFKVFRRFNSSERNVLDLAKRGFFQNIFPSNAIAQMKYLYTSSPQTFYAGFDPTAESLHIGNLLIIIGLLHCQRAGHEAIALLGGATAMVGDPSGRNTERKSLEAEKVKSNLDNIRKQIHRVFNNHEELLWESRGNSGSLRPLRIVNNADWYSNMSLLQFMENYSKYFRLGSMLSRSSVQSRLQSEQGMSFCEFAYQVFQAYDWLHLYNLYNCRFQIGGSDQMGNMMTGYELINRIENKAVYALTLPLVTNEEGDKFGKSAGNAIWLDDNKTSAFSLYQFFMRVADADVENLLKLFTLLPLEEIETVVKHHKERPERREAQRLLAQEVTLLIHGEAGYKKALEITDALYKGNIDTLGSLNHSDIEQTLVGAQVTEMPMSTLNSMSILDIAMKARCFLHKHDAIRIIAAGGFYINQKKNQNISDLITQSHILPNHLTLLRVGKKNYHIIKWATS